MVKCANCKSNQNEGGHVYEHGLTAYLCKHCFVVFQNLDRKTGNLNNFLNDNVEMSQVDRNIIEARKKRNS